MLALSSGNAALYQVQTWTFYDSRIQGVNEYALTWGLPLGAALVTATAPGTGATLADGSLTIGLPFWETLPVALFVTSKATRQGVAALFHLTACVELWRGPVALAWGPDPTLLVATA